MRLITNSIDSAINTYQGLKWIWEEIISKESKRNQGIALVFLLLTNLALMTVPYTVKQLTDNPTDQFGWLLAGLVLSLGSVGANLIYDFFREHAWNNNYLMSNITIARKLFERTLDELVTDTSEVSVEQVESIKDRVQNILYLFMFDLSVVLVTIVSATILAFTVDVVAGMMLLGLTVFNIGWFVCFNAKLDEAMTDIDKEFRKASRRLIEKLTYVLSIKSGGAEDKVLGQIEAEIAKPLKADLKIWAGWFLQVETIRRLVNGIAPMAVIYYGLTIGEWSSGTIWVMFFWIFMVAKEYGFIGHLMRHLSSQVARLKAARLALSKEPEFRHNVGAPYTPTPLEEITCASN